MTRGDREIQDNRLDSEVQSEGQTLDSVWSADRWKRVRKWLKADDMLGSPETCQVVKEFST